MLGFGSRCLVGYHAVLCCSCDDPAMSKHWRETLKGDWVVPRRRCGVFQCQSLIPHSTAMRQRSCLLCYALSLTLTLLCYCRERQQRQDVKAHVPPEWPRPDDTGGQDDTGAH